MKKIGRYTMATAAMAVVSSLASLAPAAAGPLPVNLSGYEFLLGTSCTINGQAGTCDVQFGGWTGGKGRVANGWTPFPGTGEGLWKTTVDYVGKAKFDGQVELVSGSFDVLFTNGMTISGKVTGGTVKWPVAGGSIGCGTDVAVVSVNVAFSGAATGSGLFVGCLHDLPAGSVIPPRIWGTLE
jgi:hypothetical protein